jgi:hypothetical protein
MLIVPDLGYLVVASGLAALTWGNLRTVLVYLALHRRNALKPEEESLAPASTRRKVEDAFPLVQPLNRPDPPAAVMPASRPE